MTLLDIIDTVRSQERTLVVKAPPDWESMVSEVQEYFESQNVTVVYEPVETDEAEGVVLREGSEDHASVSLDALRALIDPQVVRRLGESVPYSPLIDGLSDTTFTSFDREQMLTASREIEDRAWREGYGGLFAGFQRYSIFEEQRDVYAKLAESDLEVHVFGDPDVDPAEGPYEIHQLPTEEIRRSWFVVYDGGGRGAQASALLAEERTSGEYYGFWTYDPSLVRDILEALPTTTQRFADR